MNAQDFAYWLQGFAELNQQPPTFEQWQSIREHLATVFRKVTPASSPAERARDAETARYRKMLDEVAKHPTPMPPYMPQYTPGWLKPEPAPSWTKPEIIC